VEQCTQHYKGESKLIITDKFVFLHFPKTGGLFVTDILHKVHKKKTLRYLFFKPPMYQELMLPNVKRIYDSNIYNQHGTYDQIPEEHRSKTIISCVRNPFDRYVSTYEFRQWTKRKPDEMEKIIKLYPEFPDLTFEQYLKFANVFDIANRTYSPLLRLDVGMITYTFIQFFFKNPKRIIENLDESYLNSNEYKRDMAEVFFLHSENLNSELRDFLLRLNYRRRDLFFINAAERKNVTVNRIEKKWRKYYTKDMFDFVKFKERFILRLFPEYNEEYQGVFR
jgi:hypothetical protein